jgi:hypothetical protein
MSNVFRVCPDCGEQYAMEARFCPSCGYDIRTGLPAQNQNLPVPLGKAALPVLAGVAGLALRAAWKLMQSKTAQDAARSAVQAVLHAAQSAPPAETKSQAAPPVETQPPVVQPQVVRKSRRTIRIRTSWAVGDANGIWRHGTSDQTIEFDD